MRKTLYSNHLYPNNATCAPSGSKGRLKQNQSGMTLIEVLVAMFVLAVGVLALLATQLRTVSSVREAESQTIVAQAVQNLIEGMQINPTLCVKSKDEKPTVECEAKVANTPDDWVVKSYDNHLAQLSREPLSYRFQTPKKVRACSQSRWCKPEDSTALNKRQILEDHSARFEDSLYRALPNAEAWYIICNDNSGRDMTISGTSINQHCSNGATHPLVIKVLWQIDTEKANEDALTINEGNKNKLVFTYQARIPN